jgi:uncharacterized repeat protein (TIGR01451 family)
VWVCPRPIGVVCHSRPQYWQRHQIQWFGSSVLINVIGETYTTIAARTTFAMEIWNGSSYTQLGNELSGQSAAELEALRRSMLWNFADATSIQIANFAWHGSILAPIAAVTFDNGQLNGTLIAGSLFGTGETHLHPPDQICLPDPGTQPPPPPVEPPPVTPPGVTPPPITPEVPSFGEEEPPAQGTLPGAGRARFGVRKEVLNRRGRRVDLLRARPGQLVRFRLFGYNLGFRTVRGVVACDRVPAGLQLVRAPGDPTLRRGRLCWNLGDIATQAEGIVTFRVRRNVCGRITNTLTVRSENASRRSDSARVSACRSAPPAVTG